MKTFGLFGRQTVYDNIPEKLDVIFTSEDYGEPFAKVLGCEHVLVDKERLTIPISGTLVRENAFNHWDTIPDIVKPNFTKNIVIIGPESTGKTTLCKNLATFFQCDCIPEFGRTYTENMTDLSQLTIGDFERIALGQIFENLKSQKPNKFKFIDTEAITTKVFGQLYLGNLYESKDIEKMIETQKFDLWFLMDIDVPFVQDGNRIDKSIRKEHLRMLIKELDKRKIKYIFLGGNFDDRYENAKNELTKL